MAEPVRTVRYTGVALKDPKLFRQQAYIDGRWVDADSKKTFDVDNPATGEMIGHVPDMGAAETRRAIEAAERAYPGWRKTPAKARAAILRKWFDLMTANADDLALLMVMEQGKPMAEAKGEVGYGASFLEWFAEEAKRAYGDVIPTTANDRRYVVTKEPIGVVACITPWNFPIAMITRKAGPAIAAGCTVVLKPSELTPYSAFALAELAERAGLPKGVLNIVTGDAPAIGKELTGNPIVRKLGFTGSTEVGKLLMGQCAGTVKKVSLELGGNAPFIVFDDADLDAAVEGAIASKYRNTGQTCVCANRILVQDSVYDAFAEKLAAAVRKLNPAPGTDPAASQGPLIEDAAVAKVERHVADAVAKGGKILVGGKRHARGGRFFEPTVIVDVTDKMAVAKEETFGPLAPLFRFKTEEDAVRMANDTEFGLAAYFYGRDIGRVWRVAEALEYGLIGVNAGVIATAEVPFGGMKESGIGREGSKYGLEEFMEIKYICMGGV
ncbi:MAG: NAD-dependent succinate-semialdehyde dehydrogenase [Azospirillum sp.]|nr:NAD-dependent succinate-semialdehyde dehydrogenase [Azospirillum sp.]MCA3267694.1 NAD-dependent succinate-semialdehyde dehydrogenase [Azospirillum sp.]MCZ8124796.1 NAD-dependent succinate-semialdehyde dehydrogenase [Magnetospirillum sp.]